MLHARSNHCVQTSGICFFLGGICELIHNRCWATPPNTFVPLRQVGIPTESMLKMLKADANTFGILLRIAYQINRPLQTSIRPCTWGVVDISVQLCRRHWLLVLCLPLGSNAHSRFCSEKTCEVSIDESLASNPGSEIFGPYTTIIGVQGWVLHYMLLVTSYQSKSYRHQRISRIIVSLFDHFVSFVCLISFSLCLILKLHVFAPFFEPSSLQARGTVLYLIGAVLGLCMWPLNVQLVCATCKFKNAFFAFWVPYFDWLSSHSDWVLFEFHCFIPNEKTMQNRCALGPAVSQKRSKLIGYWFLVMMPIMGLTTLLRRGACREAYILYNMPFTFLRRTEQFGLSLISNLNRTLAGIEMYTMLVNVGSILRTSSTIKVHETLILCNSG